MLKRVVTVVFSLLFLAIAFWTVSPDDVFQIFLEFPLWLIFTVLCLLSLNLVSASFRLTRILSHFGMNFPLWLAFKANISGLLASLFFISIFGQAIGRSIVLRQVGVSSAFNSSLIAYERFVVFFISSLLCFVGAGVVVEASELSKFIASASIFEIIIVGSISLAFSLYFRGGGFEKDLFMKLFKFGNIANFLEISLITLVTQAFVFVSFIITIISVYPNVDYIEVLAATAIVCFAAGLPISINGWGIRELTAMYAFGQIGVPNSTAVAVSIFIGVCSTIMVFVFSTVFLKKENIKTVSLLEKNAKNLSTDKATVYFLVKATAILILFQAYVTLFDKTISINFADPFAILALAFLVLYSINSRQFPQWKIVEFNWILIAITLLILFGFLNGVLEIGVTQWAFVGRLLGWLVILGYLSIGPLLVTYFGAQGVRFFGMTIAVTASVIIIFQVIMRWLQSYGLIDWLFFTYNFEGYAGNRNAFSFQMLICSVFLLSYFKIYAKAFGGNDLLELKTNIYSSLNIYYNKKYIFGFSFLHGIILAGIVFSGSRAGIITTFCLFFLVWFMTSSCRFFIKTSLFFSVFICFVPIFFELIGNVNPIYSAISSVESDTERWKSIANGLKMWQESPLLGAGLGVFIHKSTEWSLAPVVIHSTPVWILAEFGLLGAAIFLWAFIKLILGDIKSRTTFSSSHPIILLLIVFVVFGLVHDMFYQRIFWLVLGIFLATFPSKKDETINL